MKQLVFLAVLLAATDPPALYSQMIASPDSSWLRVRAAISQNHPEVVARKSALDVAAARIRAVGTAPPIEVSAETEEGFRSTRVDLSRELWSGGRRAAERAVAESGARRSRVELELAERRIVIRADQLLLSSAVDFAVAERLASADSLLAAAEESLRERFAVGGARYADVLRLRAERLRLQSDRVSRSSQAEITRATLLGMDGGREDAFAASVDTAIRHIITDTTAFRLPEPPALDSLLPLSPGVRLAEADIAAVRMGLSVARAGGRPVLLAGLGVQRFEAASGYRLGPTLSASLTLPFTSAGPRRGVTVAELDIVRAETARAAATAYARIDLGSMIARYRTARQRLLIYDAGLLRGARDERESALAAFRTGDLTLLELLDFEIALMRAEIARLETRAEATDALAEMLSGEAHDAHATRTGEDR